MSERSRGNVTEHIQNNRPSVNPKQGLPSGATWQALSRDPRFDRALGILLGLVLMFGIMDGLVSRVVPSKSWAWTLAIMGLFFSVIAVGRAIVALYIRWGRAPFETAHRFLLREDVEREDSKRNF
jgi:hypothetical protein